MAKAVNTAVRAVRTTRGRRCDDGGHGSSLSGRVGRSGPQSETRIDSIEPFRYDAAHGEFRSSRYPAWATPPGQARPTLRDVADGRRRLRVDRLARLQRQGSGRCGDRGARARRGVPSSASPAPTRSPRRCGRAAPAPSASLVEGRLRMAFRDPFAIAVLDGLAEELDAIPTGMLLSASPPATRRTWCRPRRARPRCRRLLALRTRRPSLASTTSRRVASRCSAPACPDDKRDHPGAHRRACGRRRDRPPRQALGHRRVANVAMSMTADSVAGPVTAAEDLPGVTPPCRRRGRLDGFRDVFGRGAGRSRRATARRSRAASSPAAPCSTGPRESARPPSSRSRTSSPPGVVIAAEELGLRVPDDLSVTGFDGVDLPWLPHRLTTMDQHGQREGPHPRHARAPHPRGPAPAQRHPARPLREGTTTAPTALSGIRHRGWSAPRLEPREDEDTPRTWKSSPTLAAFLPWGSSERYHHAGCRRPVYAPGCSTRNAGSVRGWRRRRRDGHR